MHRLPTGFSVRPPMKPSFGGMGIVSGPTQTAFPDPSTHRPHALGQPAVENLRRLASRRVHHPDSQVDMVRMEPGALGDTKW